jgi:hypothetical protein
MTRCSKWPLQYTHETLHGKSKGSFHPLRGACVHIPNGDHCSNIKEIRAIAKDVLKDAKWIEVMNNLGPSTVATDPHGDRVVTILEHMLSFDAMTTNHKGIINVSRTVHSLRLLTPLINNQVFDLRGIAYKNETGLVPMIININHPDVTCLIWASERCEAVEALAAIDIPSYIARINSRGVFRPK